MCSLILVENENKIITGAQTSLIKQRYFVYHKMFRLWKAIYYCKHCIRKNKLSRNLRRWIKVSLAWVNSILALQEILLKTSNWTSNWAKIICIGKYMPSNTLFQEINASSRLHGF